MSYFDTIAPQIAAGAFNPQAYNPWMGVPMLPKSQENAGARPSYISSNMLPIQQMNALTNIGTAASENNLRSYQAQQAALNTQFLQQRLNAFPEFMKSLEGGIGGGGAPMGMGGGMTAPSGGGYNTSSETGTPAPSASAGSGGGSGFGQYAQPVVDQLRKEGWTDAAIAGALANGQAEGGFSEPWQKSGGNENSFGHWQFNDKGELPGYLDFVNSVGGNPQDSTMQARYFASRMEELNPGFGQITDPKAATDIIETQFEKPGGAKPGQRYAQLMGAQHYLAQNTPPTQFAQANTGSATDATPDAGNGPVYATGDSHAWGLIAQGGLKGTYSIHHDSPNADGTDATVGRTPQEEYQYITSRPQGYWQGKNVVLSTGAANDPTQIGYVPWQLAALKQGGAKVVGVAGFTAKGAGGQDMTPAATQVGRMAADAGVPFQGLWTQDVRPHDPVHLIPAGYKQAASAFTTPAPQPQAAAAPGPSPAQEPQSAQAPQGAPTLPNGIDPMQLARQGAMSELFGFPNVAAPMLQAYYNSPQYKQLIAQTQKNVELQYAPRIAAAEAAAKLPYTAVRPSGSFPIPDASGRPSGQFIQAPAAPVVEPNAGVVVQPNSGATTPIGPGYTQGVKNVSIAKATGPASFHEVNVEGPYGAGYTTTEYNLAHGLGGGAGSAPVTPNVVPGTNMATNLPVPGAPPQGAAGAPPTQQRVEAAAPTFPVQTPTGPKDISQVSLGDMFPQGKGIPAPPAPPPGMTYGKPSTTITEMQKDDAERATGYAKEASENQKIYQDLAHLKDIISTGVNTSTMAPAMAELGNIAQGMGLGNLVPNKFDPNDLAVFNKASTDLVFAAVKKLAGAVKVAEIEGYRQASPSMTMPPSANLNVINDLLSQGKWQDVRANLATQYLTQTGGAPLAAFDTRFNQMAPLVDVTEAYKNEMRKTPQYQQGLARGVGLPEDLRAAGTAPTPNGMPTGMTLKRTLNGVDYYSSGDGTWHHY